MTHEGVKRKEGYVDIEFNTTMISSPPRRMKSSITSTVPPIIEPYYKHPPLVAGNISVVKDYALHKIPAGKTGKRST